jgi:hypothetical protein
MKKTLALLSLLLLALACAPNAELAEVLAPERGAGASLGERGAYGVLRARRSFGAGLGSSSTEVSVPFLDDREVGPRPPVVFLQGGLVPAERYRWLTTHMASRGFVVLSPDHLLDLAFFSQDASLQALRGAREQAQDPDDPLFGRVGQEPGLILGHSLGGVVAAKAYANTEPSELSHLALLASEPDPADSFGGRAGRVLSVTGGADGRIEPERVAKGARAFPAALVAEVEGMNHFAWTDEPTEGELSSDGEATRPLDEVRADALFLLDSMLEDLTGRAAPALGDPGRWPAAVTLLELD